MIYEINHIWTAEMKWKWRSDRRSERNLCNCVKKPEKNLIPREHMNPQYWPAPNVSGFTAQLVEHRISNHEVTGSNPVEVLNFFFPGFFTQLHKLRSLRRSFLHFYRIELAGYLDISQWAPVSAYLISRVEESLAYRSRSYPYKNWQTV